VGSIMTDLDFEALKNELDELRRANADLQFRLSSAPPKGLSNLDGAADGAAPAHEPENTGRVTGEALQQSERALRKSEARFRAVIEKSKDAVVLSSADGRTLYMSPAGERIFGADVAALVNRDGFELIYPDDRDHFRRLLARLIECPSETVNAEFRILRSDGTFRWIEATARNLLDDPEVSAVVGNFRDVTEQRLAQEMNARLASIVEYSDDAIMGSTLDGVIQSWNQAAHRLYGYPAQEIIGQSASILIPPDRKTELRGILDRLHEGIAINRLETVRKRKDGTLFEVALTLSPVKDEKGRLVGVSAIGRDLAEQRHAEAALRRTEQQLRQAQKLEAVGSLAGGIAHDFNNLLSVILTYSTTLIRDLAPGDPMRAELEEVKRAAEKASDLTRQLLAFGGRQILRPAVIDMNRIIGGMQKIFGRVVGEQIELTLILAQGLDRTHADPGQMEQVIMNLVVNARDAMPHGGKVTIETANASFGEMQLAEPLSCPPGAYVLVTVTDTGQGMDEPTRARMFEPFFSTKKDKGTGLGLATVFGIVKQSGGYVWADSEVGHGTTFKIALPSTQAGRTTTSSTPPAEHQLKLRGSETILLVEDEEQVRGAVRNLLRRNGYHVLEAQSPGDALLVSEQYSGSIHLLLTDVIMPRMTGPELASRLLLLRPSIHVLYMSGYANRSIERTGVLDQAFSFLQKPVTPDALLGKVREVIDGVRRPLPA
jgi:PAS domain S-box-containing protein